MVRGNLRCDRAGLALNNSTFPGTARFDGNLSENFTHLLGRSRHFVRTY